MLSQLSYKNRLKREFVNVFLLYSILNLSRRCIPFALRVESDVDRFQGIIFIYLFKGNNYNGYLRKEIILKVRKFCSLSPDLRSGN